MPIKTFNTMQKYTASILEWNPINKSLNTIENNGTINARYLLLNFIPAYIERAIIGVKFGAWGINLIKANDNIRKI